MAICNGFLRHPLAFLLLLLLCPRGTPSANPEDNEFAEFEEFDEEEEQKGVPGGSQGAVPLPQKEQEGEDEAAVEEEEAEEFDHFQDEEEFEGLDQDRPVKAKPSGDRPDLTIAKVPLHLRSNWESFYMEFLMLAGLLVYFTNFVAGRNKNHRLASTWFNSHLSLLEENFSLVGDDGRKELEEGNPSGGGLVKDSESAYTLWCSGRAGLEGMLVELRLVKRQDLLGLLSRLVRPVGDQIVVKVTMSPASMDNFVMCVACKKTGAKLMKGLADLSTYCPEKKKPEKYGLPAGFMVMSEMGEVANAMLDAKVLSIIKKYEDCIDYIHMSDQYSGPRIQEDTQPTKLPEVKKVLLFGFNVPGMGHVSPETMEDMKPLMQLVFYCVEKVRRFKLSKEAKLKSDKNRLKVEEEFLKTTHAQRQEAAQLKREERRRVEKERMMNEEDPDKQRKWEEREHRRELKRRTPKMKQLKVKTL
ncbi:PAT complex subunit CCDC47 [Ixodes scapularis]|uniref:PAT complex subunit CCDC47 n=1 Tax=Ixodes scapularis TaxID=6945 RepID=UPI001C3837A7|nr:PAT complex subunit CCDC47 [Ixodes scapularis]